jgi:CRP/FNR family transcriptional regulator
MIAAHSQEKSMKTEVRSCGTRAHDGLDALGADISRLPAATCLRALAEIEASGLSAVLKRLEPEPVRLEPGERLFAEGDEHQDLHVVRSGALKTRRVGAHGEELVLDFHFAGELLAHGILSGRPQRCEAVALTVAEVCRFPMSAVEEAMRESLELQRAMLGRIGRSIAHDQDHAVLLGRPLAQERLAGFLREMQWRQQALGESTSRIQLPMGRADIASYLGLVIETVSRAFTRLQEEQVLKVSGRRVQVLDSKRLCELSGDSASACGTAGAIRRRA